MTTAHDEPRRFSNWTVEIKVWKILAALVILPVLVLWFRIVHQDDEVLALIRNEVVTDATGQRTWMGGFVNTNETPLRDVGVTVDFLDSQNRSVGKAEAEAAELGFRGRLEMQAALPRDAVRLRIHSVQWRMGGRGVLIGAFREPWEFGYLMTDPGAIGR
jgi:hypothetical protein